MSQFICPTCGKFNSVRYYDPSNFEDDILIVQVKGLGYGRGVEVVEKYSLLDGSDPELLDLIRDRIAVLYDLLFEAVDDDEAEDEEEENDVVLEEDESLSELDKELFLSEREEAEADDEEDRSHLN